MFLVVIALSFLATMVVTTGSDTDIENIIVDHEDFGNFDVTNNDEEVYIIDKSESVKCFEKFPSFDQEVYRLPLLDHYSTVSDCTK